MAFTVVYDANVLYPNTLRDLLIRIAQSGLVQAKWTNEILDETITAIDRNPARHSVREARAPPQPHERGHQRRLGV
ncbi:hypothetical protein [Candidatus Frankia alpina]|uniref:hypothetical protein n=1 Tax=Candidatus Frankia alpina TaxID=2699483 RepID=UPI0019688E9E|nr:hypothetical protein [Candidatus Frankia alpina]